MRVLDPGNIVWDEVIAFWIVLWLLMPAGLLAQLAAFVLFRFFDAVKPGPVAWADKLFHGFGWRGGFGILFDDLVAALLHAAGDRGLRWCGDERGLTPQAVLQLADCCRTRAGCWPRPKAAPAA